MVLPMKRTSEAPSILTNHTELFRRRNGMTVTAVRSDGDHVWGRLNLPELEIEWQQSPPYEAALNGLGERAQRTIANKMKALL
jgi:hypothetical protein